MKLNESWPFALSGGPLAQGALVRLIYTDEASTSANEPVCVVAAILVHGDHKWRPLENEMRRIIVERVPAHIPPNFVFHATEIFTGGKHIKRDEWAFEERLGFLEDVLSLPMIHEVPIAVGIRFKWDLSPIIYIQSFKFASLDQ